MNKRKFHVMKVAYENIYRIISDSVGFLSKLFLYLSKNSFLMVSSILSSSELNVPNLNLKSE